MITIAIYQKAEDKQYIGLKSVGHAGFAERGKDIICAVVSSMLNNVVNSIEKFTGDELELVVKEKVPLIAFKFKSGVSKESKLLMDSLVLGLQGIEANHYNNGHMKLIFKEV